MIFSINMRKKSRFISNPADADRTNGGMHMTSQETARLISWLESYGFSDSDVVACLKYVTTGIPPETKPQGDAGEQP